MTIDRSSNAPIIDIRAISVQTTSALIRTTQSDIGTSSNSTNLNDSRYVTDSSIAARKTWLHNSNCTNLDINLAKSQFEPLIIANV